VIRICFEVAPSRTQQLPHQSPATWLLKEKISILWSFSEGGILWTEGLSGKAKELALVFLGTDTLVGFNNLTPSRKPDPVMLFDVGDRPLEIFN
jgi:hypothetical protein